MSYAIPILLVLFTLFMVFLAAMCVYAAVVSSVLWVTPAMLAILGAVAGALASSAAFDSVKDR